MKVALWSDIYENDPNSPHFHRIIDCDLDGIKFDKDGFCVRNHECRSEVIDANDGYPCSIENCMKPTPKQLKEADAA